MCCRSIYAPFTLAVRSYTRNNSTVGTMQEGYRQTDRGMWGGGSHALDAGGAARAAGDAASRRCGPPARRYR